MSNTEIDKLNELSPSLPALLTWAVIAAGGEINIERDVMEVKGVQMEIKLEQDDSITLRVTEIA